MRKLLQLSAFFLISTGLTAQISTSCNAPYSNVDDLLDLIIGSGIAYSNPSISSFNCASGYFEGNSNIGYNSGMILATGGISSAEPGNGSSGGSIFNSDPDVLTLLNEMNSTSTFLNNLIVLEFDFEPASTEFELDYVFASNEYPINTCAENSDVFGILLSGPGIAGPFTNGAENIALVPNVNNPNIYTNTSVGINSVNSGEATSGTSEFCDNMEPNWQANSVFYVDNPEMETVNYPGFTVPLTAQADVLPCQSYHMKIVIADVGNSNNSSALFIEEASFNSIVSTEYEVQTSSTNLINDNLYEGCDGAYVTIVRPQNIDGDLWVNYHLSGTAELLVDYTLVNGTEYSTMIDSGASSVTIEIQTLEDWLEEGAETIIFELDAIGSGCTQTAPVLIELELVDQPPLNITLTDSFTLYCPGDDAELEVEITGGVGSLFQQPNTDNPYTIEWSQIGTADVQTENPLETTEYCVQVTDYCETQTLEECVTVYVNQYPELEAESDIVYICSDVKEELCVDVEGGEGNYDFEWSNGSDDQCIYDYHNEYSVVVTDGCDEEVTVHTEIYLDEAPDPFFEYLTIPHLNLGVEFNNYTPEMPGLSYFWNFGDGYYSLQEEPVHQYAVEDDYEVVLGVTTEIAGCYKEYTEYIMVQPLYYFYAPNAFTPNNDNKNDFFKTYVTGAESFEIYIYDRWGKEVFYSSDSEEGWDGTYKDNLIAAQGVYTFKATMKKLNDVGYHQETGNINLIR